MSKNEALKSISNEDLVKYPQLKKDGYKVGDSISSGDWIKVQKGKSVKKEKKNKKSGDE